MEVDDKKGLTSLLLDSSQINHLFICSVSKEVYKNEKRFLFGVKFDCYIKTSTKEPKDAISFLIQIVYFF